MQFKKKPEYEVKIPFWLKFLMPYLQIRLKIQYFSNALSFNLLIRKKHK